MNPSRGHFLDRGKKRARSAMAMTPQTFPPSIVDPPQLPRRNLQPTVSTLNYHDIGSTYPNIHNVYRDSSHAAKTSVSSNLPAIKQSQPVSVLTSTATSFPPPTSLLLNHRYRLKTMDSNSHSNDENGTTAPAKVGPMLKLIGTGSFGQVLEGLDLQTGKRVAIKMIKRKKSYEEQTLTEIEILRLLNTKDAQNQQHVVRFLDAFNHQGQQCLVFELLGHNLYDILRKRDFQGLAFSTLRNIARQMLETLAFLSQPDIRVIHCDLKPENILVSSKNQLKHVKVIDFGSSCFANQTLYHYIQSRFYRSPEVLLGLKYSLAVDMWSLGCVLAECRTGKPLFSGVCEIDQMNKIVKVLGLPPQEMVDRSPAKQRQLYFEPVLGSTTVDPAIPPHDTNLQQVHHRREKLAHVIGVGKKPVQQQFLDLIDRMLDYCPETRITPSEALQHPFLKTKSRLTTVKKPLPVPGLKRRRKMMSSSIKRTSYPRACRKDQLSLKGRLQKAN